MYLFHGIEAPIITIIVAMSTEGNDEPYFETTLSDRQNKILALLPILPSILSVAGSTAILWLVSRERKRKGRLMPYHRILFAMSLCDIVVSVTNLGQPFLVPADGSPRPWAIGNDATCTAVGALLQFGLASFWYNGMLSTNYLLTIRFGRRGQAWARTLEPWMHLVALGYPLGTAVSGIVMDVFHETDLGASCWVAESNREPSCTLQPYHRCKSVYVGYIFAAFPLILVIVWVAVNCTLIAVYVYRTGRQSSRADAHSIIQRRVLQQLQSGDAFSRDSRDSVFSWRGPSMEGSDDGGEPSPLRLPRRGRRRSSMTTREQHRERIRQVTTQSFLYVSTFALTYAPTIILRFLESYDVAGADESKFFVLLVCQAIFLPSLGFFNCMVYIRPQFLNIRQSFPNESRTWAVKRVFLGDDLRQESLLVPSTARGVLPMNNGDDGAKAYGDRQPRGDEFKYDDEDEVPSVPSPVLGATPHDSFSTMTETPCEDTPRGHLPVTSLLRLPSAPLLGGDDASSESLGIDQGNLMCRLGARPE